MEAGSADGDHVESSVQAAVALAVQAMSNYSSAGGGHRGDAGQGGERILGSGPSGGGPGDQKFSCRDGSNSRVGEQAGGCFGDQILEQRLMLGGPRPQIPGSPRDL